MKELSIEEKAKANDGNYKTYTELINRLEGVKDAIKKQNYGIAMDILCKPYPEYQIITSTELKENKEVEIKEAILWCITTVECELGCKDVEGIDVAELKSWLEKQGEQKPVNVDYISGIRKELLSIEDNAENIVGLAESQWVAIRAAHRLLGECIAKEQKPAEEIEPTPIFRIGDILKRKGKDYTFRVDRIQCGYYHSDRNRGAFFPIEEQDNWELVEQKLAWSEEDEAIYYGVIETEQYMLDVVNGMKKFAVGNISIKEECTRELNWLKSLKNRVQPKQGWSEEDEKVIKSILNHYKFMDEEWVNWLKSLKDRVQPQSQWKPSDEQMEALKSSTYCQNEQMSKVLFELYQDLKKLREE